MNEFKPLSIRPFLLRVVELEEDVGRRGGGLEVGGYVCGGDFGEGVERGDVGGPVGGAGAEVEDSGCGGGDVGEGGGGGEEG